MLKPLPDTDGPDGAEERLGMLRYDGACGMSLPADAPGRTVVDALPVDVCACTPPATSAATMIANHLLVIGAPPAVNPSSIRRGWAGAGGTGGLPIVGALLPNAAFSRAMSMLRLAVELLRLARRQAAVVLLRQSRRAVAVAHGRRRRPA